MTPSRRSKPVLVSLLLAPLLALSVTTACRGATGTAPALKELQRVKAGDLQVVVLADHADVKQGKDTWTLEFRGADRRPA